MRLYEREDILNYVESVKRNNLTRFGIRRQLLEDIYKDKRLAHSMAYYYPRFNLNVRDMNDPIIRTMDMQDWIKELQHKGVL